jgi:hypothetical protein
MADASGHDLYATMLGPAWATLPSAVRRLHQVGRARGRLTIERGQGAPVRWLAGLLGFPRSGENVATLLVVERRGAGQTWSRRFGEEVLISRQRRDGGGHMAERMGLFECRFRLSPTARGLDYEQVGACLAVGPLCLPLPHRLGPRVTASTWAEERGMGLDVSVFAPLFGRVLRYHGVVAPDSEEAAS